MEDPTTTMTHIAPVAGHSWMFSWQQASETAEMNMKFVGRTINERIMFHDLPNGSGQYLHFVENTNLHNLPPRCRGVLVAITENKSLCVGRNCDPNHSWFLGVILTHSLLKTLVVQVTSIDISLYMATNEDKCFKLSNSMITLEPGSFILKYLNVINGKNGVSKDGYIKSSLLGPDCMSLPTKILKLLKRQTIDNDAPPSKELPMITNGVLKPTGLLHVLHSNKSRCIKRKTMAVAGTYVVELEGPIEHLASLEWLHRKSILVPFVDAACPVGGTEHGDKEEIRYAHIPIEKYATLALEKRDKHQHNAFITKVADGITRYRLFRLTDYKHGLMFVFRPSRLQFEVTIVKEYVTDAPMEHQDFDGLVLSHWHRSPKVLVISPKELNAVEDMYVNRGFGNRASVACGGINAYTGIKDTQRTIGNPVTAPEDVPFAQMWRQGDATYAPIINKEINILTAQSSSVMTSTNNLVDRFYHKVEMKVCQEEFGLEYDKSPDIRRYCALSILTCGSKKSKSDSFFNEPHVDKNDKMDAKFQLLADRYISDLDAEYGFRTDVQKDLKYLRCLKQVGRGFFSVPTTCGYCVVEKESSDYVIHPTFALIGLDVAVEMCSSSYHYFFGALFAHCTPVALSMNSDGVVSVNTQVHNVVGWGVGKSKKKRRQSQRLIERNRAKRKRN